MGKAVWDWMNFMKDTGSSGLDDADFATDKLAGVSDVGANSFGLLSAFSDGPVSDIAGIAGGGCGTASGILNIINGGINAKKIKNDGGDNADKASAGLGITGGILGSLGGLSDIGGGIAGLFGDKGKSAKRGFGIASGCLGALGGLVGAGKGIADVVRARRDRKELEKKLAEATTDEEREKIQAQIAATKGDRAAAISGIASGLFGAAGGVLGAVGNGIGGDNGELLQKIGAGVGNGAGLLSSGLGVLGLDKLMGSKFSFNSKVPAAAANTTTQPPATQGEANSSGGTSNAGETTDANQSNESQGNKNLTTEVKETNSEPQNTTEQKKPTEQPQEPSKPQTGTETKQGGGGEQPKAEDLQKALEKTGGN